jgi:hypothetical protein
MDASQKLRAYEDAVEIIKSKTAMNSVAIPKTLQETYDKLKELLNDVSKDDQ